MSNINKPATTFIIKYKPYFLNEFSLDESLHQMILTLFDIDDLNTLFIGESGTGKTTLLYAIIREYYGLSKTDSIPETNILFVNTIKEQGINYFRNEMKTFCQSTCSIYGKKKMIIIDDIDMVNEQSQHVFRNYIDKYSKNIHFISVCTNIQKVIESIQSRVHILKLKLPTREDIENIMNYIIEKECIIIDDKSKEYLLFISGNSIRTMINHLEKIYIYRDGITYDICDKLCSSISNSIFEKYINYLKEGEILRSIQLIYEISDTGYSVIDILDFFFTFVKQTELIDEETKYIVIPTICKYIIIFHTTHEDIIELALFTNNLYSILHHNQK
jgi:DNA polymerase III delta prime subunit